MDACRMDACRMDDTTVALTAPDVPPRPPRGTAHSEGNGPLAFLYLLVSHGRVPYAHYLGMCEQNGLDPLPEPTVVNPTQVEPPRGVVELKDDSGKGKAAAD